MNEKVIQGYIQYVEKTIGKYSEIGKLIDESVDEISPHRLNLALAKFYDISLALSSEYQRQKINHSVLETDYQIWYDEKFLEAKSIVMSEYENSRSIKPSLKEYEVTLRRTFRDEWKEWDNRIKESEARTQFLLRLRESLNKYDSILITISQNMRTEMRALSIDTRSNANPEVSTGNRVRQRFPVKED